MWWGVEPPLPSRRELRNSEYFMLKCTANKADPVGNHLYHVSEEVWTPPPAMGPGRTGGSDPLPRSATRAARGAAPPGQQTDRPQMGRGGGKRVARALAGFSIFGRVHAAPIPESVPTSTPHFFFSIFGSVHAARTPHSVARILHCRPSRWKCVAMEPRGPYTRDFDRAV